MEMGMVGLGRMGGNMVLRLVKRGHRMIAYDRSPDAVQMHVSQGAVGVHTLEEFVKAFESKPRVMWVMVPAGDPTTHTIHELADLGQPGDIVIDGGNTNWKLALEDAAYVKSKGMHYMDAGTSGGIWGLINGYCLMVGSERSVFDHCLPLLKGLMEAYAEGFEIMKQAKAFPGMDMLAIAEAWRTGSVIRSWLLDLIANGLRADPELSGIRGYVEDTGEGRWTVEAAIEESVPAAVITTSLFARFRSRMENTFGDRMLAMMRAQFGGHGVVKDTSGETARR